MNKILHRLAEAFRRALKLQNIEYELGQIRSELCSQIAEQETRTAAILSLLINQQHLLMEKISLLQEELDRIAALQEQRASKEK